MAECTLVHKTASLVLVVLLLGFPNLWVAKGFCSPVSPAPLNYEELYHAISDALYELKTELTVYVRNEDVRRAQNAPTEVQKNNPILQKTLHQYGLTTAKNRAGTLTPLLAQIS